MESGWDLEIEKKCLVCGSSMTKLTVPICDKCRSTDNGALARAKNYLEIKPDASIEEIAKYSKMPEHAIKWHIKKGNLVSYEYMPAKDTINNPAKDIAVSDEVYGKYIWVKIAGKLDSPNSYELQNYIEGLINDGCKDIVLDMKGVKFFCSTAVRVVLTAYKKLHEVGSLRIANPSKNVESTLGTIALDRLLII